MRLPVDFDLDLLYFGPFGGTGGWVGRGGGVNQIGSDVLLIILFQRG